MTGELTHALGRRYGEFQQWRSGRPFAGGVLLVLAGMTIGYVPMQFLHDIAFVRGSFVLMGLTFGILVSLAGVFVLLRPEHSTFFGVAGVVLSTLSIVGALGGMFVGMVLGTIGGVLCFAWRPVEDGDGEGESTITRLKSLGNRNLASVVLLGLTVVLMLYFLHPLIPPLGSLAPSAEGITVSSCDPAQGDVPELACQNPPIDQGLGGALIFIGDFDTPGITNTEQYIETSAVPLDSNGDGIASTLLTLENPDYSRGPYATDSPYSGFVLRKNLETPGGQGYSLFVNSSSGTIDGGSDQAIELTITEIYADLIDGTALGFISVTYDDEISCEPRNYGAIDLGSDLDATVDATGLAVNAHYAQASQWTLNDFDISVLPNARSLTAPKAVDTVDNCPGDHPRG